jgi:metal-sulfur cluster biosynthetic enzyme
MSWQPFWRRRPPSTPPEIRATAATGAAAPSAMEARALDALRGVDDPELGVNIVDLGLIYGIEAGDGRLGVRLTMTTPSCPLGDHLTGESELALRRAFPEIGRVEVDLVWDPPWRPERMTAAAKRQLGWG